jgi:hypothetical protein
MTANAVPACNETRKNILSTPLLQKASREFLVTPVYAARIYS